MLKLFLNILLHCLGVRPPPFALAGVQLGIKGAMELVILLVFEAGLTAGRMNAAVGGAGTISSDD